MRPTALVLTVALVIGTFVDSVAAQAPTREVTVEALVAEALRSHPELQAARLEVDAATARVQQAGLRPNPTLDLGGQKALGPDSNLTVGLTLPLDLNGRKEGRVGLAEREHEMRRALLAERERRLRADIRTKAGDVLAARRNLTTTSDLLDANRRALGVVRDRVREGAAPALDEGLQLVEVTRLEASQALLASRVEVLTLQLKTVAGLAVDAPLTLVDELNAAPVPLEVETALSRAAQERPDVRLARAEVATGSARVRKEQAEGRWDASVNVGYQRTDMGFDLMGITDRGGTRRIQDTFHYFGGGISIVLPVRNRNQGSIAAAESETRAAERRQRFVELALRQEVVSAFAQHAAARRAVEMYDTGVRGVARRNLDVVRQAYALGRGSLLDVIGEQRRYLEIEGGYTTVLKDAYDAEVEIERATGFPAR
jgi:cobalt-zinc-cadmium efflux system outer membrane protein